MVYLLHSYFGRDGRDDAEELLERRSGNSEKPRILEAFNTPIDTWLDFFCFTMFTDRDGKSQLLSLSESALDPLSRTTRFMLTEEAHHMFVGETGLARIIERTCQILKENRSFSEDVRKFGAIDLEMIQRHVNFWFSQSLDLHGSEVSSNAASYFANGLKGRAKEDSYADDHQLVNAVYDMRLLKDGKLLQEDVPMRNAMNEVLRDWYIGDCEAGVERWNKRLESHGIAFRFTLPDRKFCRHIGVFSGFHFDPHGNPLAPEQWEARKHEWLPSPKDKEFLLHIQHEPVFECGKFANYIAPPTRGIKGKPIDFEYVRTES